MATVQVCDGSEDRSGDGGGDQLASGYMTVLYKVNPFWVDGTCLETQRFLAKDPALCWRSSPFVVVFPKFPFLVYSDAMLPRFPSFLQSLYTRLEFTLSPH